MEIWKGIIQSELMISGEYVSDGQIKVPRMSRLWTITNQR